MAITAVNEGSGRDSTMRNRGLLLVSLFTLGLRATEPLAAAPLFQAIQSADISAVKALLRHGANPDALDADGTPVLMAAALYAGPDCIKLLLDAGANPNAANTVGATPLMWAVPDLVKVKLLLSHGADVNARSTNLQRTPLLIAARYPGSVEVLRLLLDKGADLHAKDRNGASALGLATTYADVGVVHFLVENGSNMNEAASGVFGGSVGSYTRHYLPTAEYLMSKGAKIDPAALTLAAGWLDPKVIEKWIEMGADVNARVRGFNRTPLITAASSEGAGPATLKLLLEKGAEANAEDIDGERALDWAMYRQDQRKIAVLEQYGAKPGSGPRHQTYPAPEGIADARTSLSRSVSLLLPPAPVVFRNRGCITCHSQSMPQQVAVSARAKGVAINEELASSNLKQILAVFKPAAEAAMQGNEPAGRALTIGYIMMALADEHHPLDKVTAPFTHLVAASQMPDGSWIDEGISRPPMEHSEISITAMAVRTLTLYPIAGSKEQLAEKLQRARAWLVAAQAKSAEERSMRLMGLVWTKASRGEVHSAVREIVAQQRPDGGWSQLPQLDPDAYATGISLYALHQADISVTGDIYKKGVSFLLKNQHKDGSWFVKTRSYPVQPYLDSGYPYGFNQWISAAGASWASLAIAYTLPDAGPTQSAIH
jgi:ankyrin repeat protein